MKKKNVKVISLKSWFEDKLMDLAHFGMGVLDLKPKNILKFSLIVLAGAMLLIFFE